MYSGAILTAVCWREVVAPPMSRGRLEAAPFHLATFSISPSEGVISPEQPTISQPSAIADAAHC